MPDKIEMAKAYVQIVPSADGIRAALTDVFDEETDGLGAKVGQSIGAQLVGTIKKVLAAAGIGKIIKDSIDMGGALQQSIGGIETLFKDSADTVKQYAAQAYQTVGLSANDYMEQTTSFAASLLSSVSKDTNAAAQLANMAMVDMARICRISRMPIRALPSRTIPCWITSSWAMAARRPRCSVC